MSDHLNNKIRFRTLNVMDDYNRQILGIDIARSMPSQRVVGYLDQVAEEPGYPQKIRVDNGSEFSSHHCMDWATTHQIHMDYIKLGCPYQNGYIERFNRSYRSEGLDCYRFSSLNEGIDMSNKWIEVYNTSRPHDSLGDMSPKEYKQAQFYDTTVS